MTWRDRLHTRFVAWMKIVLPLSALGILSMLFLISESFDTSQPLPVAGIDLQERARAQGATRATFAGVTRTGHEVILRTERTRPSPEDAQRFLSEDVTVGFVLKSGTRIDIASLHGDMNQRDNSAALSGEVTIVTSTGYRLATERLIARFDTLYAEAPGPVFGDAPAGDLTAGRMVLANRSGSGAPHLVFSNGVKLVYDPRDAGDRD